MESSSGSSSASPSALSDSTDPNQEGAEPALLGARQDVRVNEDAPAPCHCLQVVLGTAQHPALTWTSAPPRLDQQKQLVLAFSSEHLDCDVEAPTASYRGYSVEGEHVIVHLEGARAGRPITRGAILPRPGAGGQVFLESSPGLPYGALASPGTRCALGSGS